MLYGRAHEISMELVTGYSLAPAASVAIALAVSVASTLQFGIALAPLPT
jgi:hypothetical protein